MPLPPPPPELVELETRRAPHGTGILLGLCASVLFWALVLLAAARS